MGQAVSGMTRGSAGCWSRFQSCVSPEIPSRREVILSKQDFEKPLPQASPGL